MIEDWGIGATLANALGFSTTAFATGAVTTAFGQVLETLPGSPSLLAYLIFFVVLPVTGFFSDVEEMIVRGLIFTIFVGIFSSYIFNDTGEVIAAFFAFLIALLISALKESYW